MPNASTAKLIKKQKNNLYNLDNDLFGPKAFVAAEAALDRDAFLEKPPFLLVLCHWTRQLMLSSSSVQLNLGPGTEEASVVFQTTVSSHWLDDDNDFLWD